MSENEQKQQTEEQPKKEENATPAESTEPATNAVEENGVKEDGDAGKTEEAKKEEGGAAEGKTENAAAEAKTDAKEEVNLEAPKENPFSEDDLEQILQLEASEGEDNGWQKGKNQKGVTVFKKSEKNGVPIIKVRMSDRAAVPCCKRYTMSMIRQRACCLFETHPMHCCHLFDHDKTYSYLMNRNTPFIYFINQI